MHMISKEVQFDMGHRVPNHKSKCSNPHGHRYRVVAQAIGELNQEEGDSSEGMVIDFGDLKTIMMNEIHDRYDHGFMAAENDLWAVDAFADTVFNFHVVPFIPTAENLAKHFFDLIEDALVDRGFGLTLLQVAVYETPTSVASFIGEG